MSSRAGIHAKSRQCERKVRPMINTMDPGRAQTPSFSPPEMKEVSGSLSPRDNPNFIHWHPQQGASLVAQEAWTARRSNQSILKNINPEYSLEGLMLKQKLQILWPHDAKSQHIGKDPDSGNDRGLEEKWVTEGEMVGWHH